MKDDLVIIRTDGGICSQIMFAALGNYFSEKGYHVKYDTTWFEENGKDINGERVRNYDMDKAFPDLNLEIATKEEIKRYKKKYCKNLSNASLCQLEKYKPPIYIDRYPSIREPLFLKFKDFFANKFKFLTDDAYQLNLLKEIELNNSCGVHIRRGDYMNTSAFTESADESYYNKAINIINKTNENVHFYFFSDDMDWVKEKLLPLLGNINYTICDKNSDDKGYLDLYLLSRCKHIISSNGSLGFTAFLLSKNNDVDLWMCKYREFLCKELNNIYIINCPDYRNNITNESRTFLGNLCSVYKDSTNHIIIKLLGIKIKFKLKRK